MSSFAPKSWYNTNFIRIFAADKGSDFADAPAISAEW